MPYALKRLRKNVRHSTCNRKYGFKVGTYEGLDNFGLVVNLTPDKQHSKVVADVMPLMKKDSAFGYSHGFNII